MRVVTINVPEPYLALIDMLVGVGGLYPSRSELYRVAVRDFLSRELPFLINMIDDEAAQQKIKHLMQDKRLYMTSCQIPAVVDTSNEPRRRGKNHMRGRKRLELQSTAPMISANAPLNAGDLIPFPIEGKQFKIIKK